MNRFLYIALFVLICHQASAEDVEPQIKVTRIQLWYANPKYVDRLSYYLTKHNATYNNIGVHWTLGQDLPANVNVNTKVYATDSKHKNPRLLLEDNTPICRESPNRRLLPHFVVFEESQLHGKCVKSGVLDAVDMGNFRFEVLIPEIHEISDYHYTHFRVGTKKELVLEATFYSEWGYLNH